MGGDMAMGIDPTPIKLLDGNGDRLATLEFTPFQDEYRLADIDVY